MFTPDLYPIIAAVIIIVVVALIAVHGGDKGSST
jgi:hypothetical protein